MACQPDDQEHAKSSASNKELVRLAFILPLAGCVFGTIGGRVSLETIDLETTFRNAIAYWPVVALAALLGALGGWQSARFRGLVIAPVASALFIVIAGTIAL